MATATTIPMPARFADLKREIIANVPNAKETLTAAWKDILGQLAKDTTEFKAQGSNVVFRIPSNCGFFAEEAALDYPTSRLFRARQT